MRSPRGCASRRSWSTRADFVRCSIVPRPRAVLADEFYVFPNGAVTGVLLLAQSHLSIHTWPELLLANIDLLTYGDVDADAVLGAMRIGLEAERFNVVALTRGTA